MKPKYNLLSLDPMYSPLHEEIAKLVAKKKYAVTSCWSKKIYLPSFQFTLATDLIKQVNRPIAYEITEIIKNLSTYHHAYVKKIEKRSLNSSELHYMAKFYVGLKAFMLDKNIDLVLLHSDTRWYHAVAIAICKELGIQYLVTEQGLIRPYTTIIDNLGVNAVANVDLLNKPLKQRQNLSYQPKHHHESILSTLFFMIFIGIFAIERMLSKKSILRYMHNNYSVRKYYQRLINKVFKSCTLTAPQEMAQDSALLLLQLEHDSQFLMYSAFSSNQEVIDRVAAQCATLDLSLAIKKHPLDTNDYQLPSGCYFVEGNVETLSKKAKMAVSINSSAIISILNTKTPLYLIGESMYPKDDMLVCTEIENIKEIKQPNLKRREEFLTKLNNNYLTFGAGYSYCVKNLTIKLDQLLN